MGAVLTGACSSTEPAEDLEALQQGLAALGIRAGGAGPPAHGNPPKNPLVATANYLSWGGAYVPTFLGGICALLVNSESLFSV